MGGKIWFHSEQGKGSSFSFTVPVSQGSKPSTINGLKKFHLYKGLNALVVDDNAANRRILETALSTWGFRVSNFDSGQAALDWLRDCSSKDSRVSLILLDCCMPTMDGYELTEKIRSMSEYTEVPVIMLTSAGMYEAKAGKYEKEIFAFLTKPVKMTSLMSSVESALNRKKNLEKKKFAGTEEVSDQAGARRLRILLAEDNPVNQKLALRMLEKMGHVVTVVSNGKQAVESLEINHYDIFLTDIQMPEMDGYEATRIIRSTEMQTGRPRVPIIAMTAYAMQRDREMCMEAGMDGYVSKPVRSRELAEALNQIQLD